MRTFEVAECCLNCSHRESRNGKNVICLLDGKWYSERLICSEYKRTESGSILRQEKVLLDQSVIREANE